MRVAFLWLFGFLFCCGCASPKTQQRQVGAERTLAPGDCIIVDNAHRQGLETRHVIDAAGDISLSLLGKFHVAGLTLNQAEVGIEKEYVDRGLFRHVDLVVLLCP
ncbi:MAG TPA: polysaccharide biosynthesis/export family protein [Verrucomicrobiae bacterium]|nr:polysaccharide biosynthesis/export family protein [Verrucomicrobiae bacterium]